MKAVLEGYDPGVSTQTSGGPKLRKVISEMFSQIGHRGVEAALLQQWVAVHFIDLETSSRCRTD
jgi:hypothetical protein